MRDVVVEVLVGAAEPAAAADALAELPTSEQAIVLADYATSLDDLEISVIAAELGLLDTAERWTRQRRWWRRLHGVRVLDLLGRGSLRIAALVDDPDPRVRAQAVGALDLRAEPERIPAALELLDDTEPLVRTAAEDALVRAGLAAVDPLRRYLDDPDAPAPKAALEVAGAIRDARLLPAALRRCDDPSPAVRRRAASLVGAIGGSEAAGRLAGLLEDDDERVRAAAAHGLGRVHRRESAPGLAARLEDPSWTVARAAAFALAGLGPAGVLFLRRARDDGGPQAAEIAARVLDLRGEAR